MVSALIGKKFLLILLASIVALIGVLSLTSADDGQAIDESVQSSQSELRLDRTDVWAVSAADEISVYQLLAAAAENKTAGPTDQQKAEWQESEQEGPPPWAAARVKDTEGWFDGERKGPPPWAAARVKDTEGWFDGDREGPPPWAGPSDEEKAEWQESEQEGPPPWAAARVKDTEGWFDGDRQGPPPWAGSKKDKSE